MMLSAKIISVALLAVAASSVLPVSGFEALRPYAPELYARESLSFGEADESRMTFKKRSVPDASSKPYSPDLYFRAELVDEEMQAHEWPPASRATLQRRSDSTFCRRDADCGLSHFCGSGGSCYMRLKRRSVCKRDAMCSSGFCGSSGSCMSKRIEGASCADGGASACAEGLFCSIVDTRCKQKRSLNQVCRTTEGCTEGLACLNYQCQSAVLEGKADKLKSILGPVFHHGPSPSGSPQHPRRFSKSASNEQSEKRFLAAPPSASGSPLRPIRLSDLSDALEDIQGKLASSTQDGQESFEELLEDLRHGPD